MAPQMLVPAPIGRSPTAMPGKSDFRDEHVYGALVLEHGAGGQQKVFTIPQGQAIPVLKGSPSATTNAWQTTYTEATTNLTKAGELGSGFGDAAIRAIGLDFEPIAYTVTTGAPRAHGATPFEVADVCQKSFFTLKISQKPQITGRIPYFPGAGGVMGSISTTGNATTAGIVTNGWPGMLRRLKVVIPCGRSDTLEGVYGIAGGATLAFGVTGSDGQPSLIFFNLFCNVAGDVR